MDVQYSWCMVIPLQNPPYWDDHPMGGHFSQLLSIAKPWPMRHGPMANPKAHKVPPAEHKIGMMYNHPERLGISDG